MEWETIKVEKTREWPSRLEVIGAVLTVGVLGFWFGIGATLGAKMVNSLEELIADNKMAEEQKQPQQVTTKEPQQVPQVTKEPQRVTTKNPKKVEAGKRLAMHNRTKREEKKREEAQKGEGVNKYYSIGVVIAIGAIGGLGYYIY